METATIADIIENIIYFFLAVLGPIVISLADRRREQRLPNELLHAARITRTVYSNYRRNN